MILLSCNVYVIIIQVCCLLFCIYMHINIYMVHAFMHIYIQACSTAPSVSTYIKFMAHSFFFCPGNKNKYCSLRAHEKKDWTGKRRRKPKRVVLCMRTKKNTQTCWLYIQVQFQSARVHFCNPYSRSSYCEHIKSLLHIMCPSVAYLRHLSPA